MNHIQTGNKNKMKGDKGICLFFSEDGEMVNKTKFDTQVNCVDRINVLLKLGVIDPETTTYKCKECGDWHLGKVEQAQKYSK